MKNFLKGLGLAALSVLTLASCQKEEDGFSKVEKKEETQKVFVKEVAFADLYPGVKSTPKKFGPPTPPSTVTDTYPTHFGQPAVTYKTRIIGNQEWIIEDWKNDCVDQDANAELGVYESPYYSGEQYYEWERILLSTSQETYDKWVFSKPGFHIPTKEDIRELVDYLGNDGNAIAQSLDLKAYNDYWSGDPFNEFLRSPKSTMQFWVNDQASPNREKGCGVVLTVDPSRSVVYGYTNIPTLAIRVRFVRNIK